MALERASSLPDAASAPRAVRKTVTVLFADLGGSTGFGERTDAEITRQVLARYHALLQQTIDAHAGTVAKFMGDGMMATWGVREVAEDDARQAVDAGVALQAAFEPFALEVEQRHGETLTLRVGVNTGEVVIGDGDADLIGDTLNVAARLEKACRPGHVLVGEETWRLTRGDLAYEALGEVAVAGRAQPVAIFEVTTATAAEDEMATPFVGRDAEMDRLLAVFGDAQASAAARLVTILGSPGVGKTRLSRELAQRAAEAADATAFEIRCDRAGGATFAPVAQLIRDAAGLGDDTDVEAARAAIEALLPAAAGAEDHARVADVLAGLVGAAPSRSVEETFWAIRRLVESVASTRPVLIVIDDIQWAEPLLLDLIEHLAEWIAGASVLLVGLARPELREVRPALAQLGRPVAAVVVLDGLDASATEALAAGLLGTGHLPAGLVDRLPTSTDGNPLFVRELIRMLIDDQVLRRQEDGSWELTIDAEAVDVPPTIQSLLGARVERLPAAERHLLELASVVGAEFSLGALRELAGESTPVPSLLDSMRRKELVEPTGTYWGDEPVHRFHHVLIRDAAYRRLLKTTRAELHERVAAWTDRTAASLLGEHETTIAHHYEQAHRYLLELGTVDDHAVALGRRAAGLLTTAAHHALERDDLAAAGGSSVRALALLPTADRDERAELLMLACECLLAAGDGAGARPLVEELGALAGDDARLGAWAACFTAQLISLTDPDGLLEADSQAQSAAGTLADLGDPSGEAKAHQVRAELLTRLGRVGDAEGELDHALAAARSADDRRRVTAVLGAAPDAALFGPSPVARAGGRCLDVIRLLRITTASPSVEAASNRCQGVLEALRGRFDVARSTLADARAVFEELGLRRGVAKANLYAGMVELLAGDPQAAVTVLRDAVGDLDAFSVGADTGVAAALLARALLVTGAIDEANGLASVSEQLAGQDLQASIGWRIARAEVLAALGDLPGAVAAAEEAVEIGARTDLVIDHADACAVLAAVRAAAGDARGADAARGDAKRLYEQKGATVLAARLDDRPDPTRGSELVGEDEGRSLENAATRVFAVIVELATGRRFDEFGSVVAEDFERVDRRTTVSAAHVGGPDAWAAAFRSTIESGMDQLTIEPIALRDERLALAHLRFSSAGGDEIPMLAVIEVDERDHLLFASWHDSDELADAIDELDARHHALLDGGLTQRVEIIDFEDWDAASRRFDELAPDSESSSLDNESVRIARDLWVAACDQRWNEVVARLSPDVVRVDHRSVLHAAPTAGVDEYLEVLRASFGRGEVQEVDVTPLAVRGERLSLNRVVARAYDFSIEQLILVGVDAGLVTLILSYDPDDLATAQDELDRRFNEPSALDPRHPRAENTMTRRRHLWEELVQTGRFDELRARLDEFVAERYARVDRRPTVAAPEASGAGVVDSLEALYDLGLVEIEATPIAVRGEHHALYRQTFRTPEGTELVLLNVHEIDATERVVFNANYDEDQLAEAIAELDARFLAGEGAEHLGAAACITTWASASAGAWEGYLEWCAHDFEVVDHRSIGWPVMDRDGFMEILRSYAEAVPDLVQVLRKVLIGQGVDLAISDSSGTTPDGSHFEWVTYAVNQPDESGRLRRLELFDEGDWSAALARFDELQQVVRPSPLQNDATRLMARFPDLARTRRFDEMAELIADSYVRVDHRQGLPAPTAHGPDDFVELIKATVEVGFDEIRNTPLAVRGEHLALSRVDVRATDGKEIVFLQVHEWRGSKLVYASHYDEGDLEAATLELDRRFADSEGAVAVAAVARFDELAPIDLTVAIQAMEARHAELRGPDLTAAEPVTRSPALENAATRALAALSEAMPDWDRLTALYAEDVVTEDRRAGVSSGVSTGREATLDLVQGWLDVGFAALRYEVLAVRAEHLTLVSRRFELGDGFEVSLLAIAEIDAEGRFTLNVLFDEDDLRSAVEALEHRYLEWHGSSILDPERTYIEYTLGFNRGVGDLDYLAEGYRMIDHSPAGFGTSDASELRDHLSVMRRQVPSLLLLPAKIHGSARAVLSRYSILGTGTDGTDFRWEMTGVECVDADGLVVRNHIFQIEQWDDAVAVFDEWSAEPAAPSPALENATTRALARFGELFAARDWDGIADQYPDEVVFDDRRTSVNSGVTTGRDDGVALVRGLVDVGFVVVDTETLAVRGDRLALVLRRWRRKDGFELPILAVQEHDDRGRQSWVALFDPDDLASAVEALDDRHLALHGATMPDAERQFIENMLQLNRGNDARHLTPGYEMIDHSPIGFGTADEAGYLEQLAAMRQMLSNLVMVVGKIYSSDRAVLSRHSLTGTTADGAEHRWEMAVVECVDEDGHIVRHESFQVEQWDDAVAAFDAWPDHPPEPLEPAT